jgi:hypothetical protein
MSFIQSQKKKKRVIITQQSYASHRDYSPGGWRQQLIKLWLARTRPYETPWVKGTVAHVNVHPIPRKCKISIK